MKIFVLAPNESWIADRQVQEWNEDNTDITTHNLRDADCIWLFADWCFDKVPYEFLQKLPVLTTIHHIVPQKFDAVAQQQFMRRDAITDVYHVPNDNTLNFIKKYTDKPIVKIPYWANQKVWKISESKNDLRTKYGIPSDALVVGSFQRDTEGHDLKSPKLEKGPDLFADYVEQLAKNGKVHVVLSGWRRQYLINRLNQASVPYTYKEMPPLNVVCELYQTLDLYVVSSRYEGGPQSLIECGLLDVPCISRDMGMSREVLPPQSVNDDLLLAIPTIPNVERLKLPVGYAEYRKLLKELVEKGKK